MNKYVLAVMMLFLGYSVYAQDSIIIKPAVKKINLGDRPGDHLMFQLSSDHWTNMPDSIKSHQSGFSRGFNAYVMFDKPFRTNPKFSLGIGVGVSTSNIAFKNMNVDIKSASTKLPFSAVDSTNHFKRYKLSLGYLEAPIELRYSSNPEENNKSWKIALGVKIGTLVNVHTKGKDLYDKNNRVLNTYTEKESNKRFFNSTRISTTARIGYGIFSIFGSYQIGNVIKDVAGPPIKAYQIGLSISGL
ncbi:MAG: hypothetical protein NVSMB45_07870 [Ginsengibacter sp.]